MNLTATAVRPARAALLAILLSGTATAALASEGALEGAAAEAADASDGASVSELTVTARRREETVQDVPLAVSVIAGARIDSVGAFNVGRLQQLAPTLQFYTSNPRNSSVNIRGLGSPFGLTSDGFEQGVGVYVDDVYSARVASATFDFLDVARIEVLRGPQGTLYGKNTTAGAISITTNQPTFDFEGKAELTAGTLDFRQAKAAISGPLSETLAARLAVSYTTRRGTIYNVTSRRWINAQDNLGLRAQLLFRPSDDLAVTFSGDFNRQNPKCCAQIYVRTGATQRALPRQYAALAAAQGYTVVSTNPFDRLTDVDSNLNAGNRIGGASARVKWDVGPGTLTSVTAWRFWDWKPENDRDFLGLSIVARSQNPSQHDQYSQELRYNYATDRIDAVVGAFAFHQRIDTQGTEQHGPASSRWNLTGALAANPAVLDGLVARNTQYLKNTSLALFGQASWKVTDAFTIQPGVRLNYDKKVGFYERKVFDGQGNPVLFGQTDPVKVAQRGVFAPQVSEPRFSDWNFSYDLTLSYALRRDVLAYATYARSFKTGGINQNGLPTDAAGNPILAAGSIRPESVDHFEAGLKSRFWEGRAILNLAAFRTDIGDYQATVTNGQLGVLRGYLANAGKVRSQGVEADFQVRPSERLSAYVNGAYADAKYLRFVDAPCPPELSGGTTATAGQTPSAPGTPGGISPANCDISGQRLPGVSKWSFSYGIEANLPGVLLGREGQAYAGFDGSYRSGFSSNPSPSAYTNVKGYALSNFRVGFRADDGIEVFGWVRNAFDVDYFEQLALGPSNTGLIVGQPGDPRTWGVTLKSAF
ncbi:TonB-dependent receptor [Phenylobacterium kunshanense]|uniref:TonB-dependent receptor n=1 Tax=Phenylobacterium kunshanense TaxID=1445034 RepID=A0A328BE96_9CAUL|nr:TonB-dependent receptor [Phenylobacterium kunshanense]RAK64975.1 TonB-dependent receptor [Phenylobacterium kunshanense]